MAHSRNAPVACVELCAVGIDAGSSTLRTALLAERGPRVELCGVACERRPDANALGTLERVIDRMLRETTTLRGDVTVISSTGEPPGEPGAVHVIPAIAHARGARYLNARVRGVLDVGDHHSAAMRLGADGSVAVLVESSETPTVEHLGGLLGQVRAPSPVLVTGGRATDGALIAQLGLECAPLEILTHPLAAFAGAIGAALWGLQSEHAREG